jgi:hypothetical protein
MLMKKLWNIHHIGPHTNRSPVISCQHRWTFFIYLIFYPRALTTRILNAQWVTAY